MPFYTVEHSYPLTPSQKTQIAQAITHSHTSKFLAPSVFVHVKFNAHDASDQTYYIAGKPRTNSTNRILGLVRTASTRTKQDFEDLAQQIEEAWYTAVSGKVIEEGKNKGKREDELEDSSLTTEAKQLRIISFYPMIAVWENGGAIPDAGQEAEWLRQNRDTFQRKADAGDELYQEMMEEITTREDLKKAFGT